MQAEVKSAPVEVPYSSIRVHFDRMLRGQLTTASPKCRESLRYMVQEKRRVACPAICIRDCSGSAEGISLDCLYPGLMFVRSRLWFQPVRGQPRTGW